MKSSVFTREKELSMQKYLIGKNEIKNIYGCSKITVLCRKFSFFMKSNVFTRKKELYMQKYLIGKNEIKKTYGRGKISSRIEILLQPVARKLIYGRKKFSNRIEIFLQTVEIYFINNYIKKQFK
jgi:hypothetical protein